MSETISPVPGDSEERIDETDAPLRHPGDNEEAAAPPCDEPLLPDDEIRP